jgi:hypothetical protein
MRENLTYGLMRRGRNISALYSSACPVSTHDLVGESPTKGGAKPPL